MLVMTTSSNGEGIFRPLVEALLGDTAFPFDWDGYMPYDKLPPLPKLKEHKRVTLTADQLNRLAGKYTLTADIVLTVTVENGRLFVRGNDEEKQEYLAESPNDFYSASSTDECSFKPETGPAQVLVLHLDNGQNRAQAHAVGGDNHRARRSSTVVTRPLHVLTVVNECNGDLSSVGPGEVLLGRLSCRACAGLRG